jgi:cation diffusion facilitator family transporter
MDIKNNEIEKVSFLGIVCNLFLLIIKLFIGIIFNSQAMIADGLNSAGDIFASLMSYIGAKIASKPSDKDHPYGHGKAEYIFAQIIGISMIVVSLVMVRNSINSIINESEFVFSIYLIIVAIITIFIKLSLFLYAKYMYNNSNSILIKSSMEDHRNDILVTLGTLIGIILGKFNIYFVDGIIGACISIWIFYIGLGIFKNSYRILMDTGLSDEIIEDIISICVNEKEVLHVDNIVTKPVGQRYIIILKISMYGEITLYESSDISRKIEETIRKKYSFVYDVIIHINAH